MGVTDEDKILRLLADGYKPFRKIYIKSDKRFVYKEMDEVSTTYLRANFNVLNNGGLDIRFIKGDEEIGFGLVELGKKPRFF